MRRPTVKKMLTFAEMSKSMIQNMEEEKMISLKEQGEEDLKQHKEEKKIGDMVKVVDTFKENREKYFKFSEDVKKKLLSTCINKIFSGALDNNVTKMDCLNNQNYINKFIEQYGVDILLKDYKTKTPMLSEFSNIVEKYHNIIIEKVDKDNPDTYKIDEKDANDFLDEIDNEEVDKVTNIIKNRVSKAIDEFIENNAEDKKEIKEIIDKSTEKISKTSDEKLAESYKIQCNRQIKELRARREQSIFENMVFNISKSSIKNEELSDVFLNEGKLDIDRIMESATVMYTFLETVNTCKLAKVDLDYINSVCRQLKS